MSDVFNGAPGQGFNTSEGDARYVQVSEHTKALHDGLLIDAATLDGLDSLDVALADGTRLRIYRATSAPSSPGTGQLWADTTATPPLIKSWTGSAWQTVASLQHGQLTGLSGDDHSIYALTDGTRLRVVRATTGPSSPGVGQLWADTTTSPATLKSWTGSAWQAFTGGSGGAMILDDLTDVTITSPTTGQLIRYNGSQFVNSTVSTGGSGSARYATIAKLVNF